MSFSPSARRTVRTTARPPSRSERGQSIVIIAVGMIGLLAFVGLTVDVGTLYIGLGHLRRAVDASAIAAASQFREGRDYEELEAAARQVVSLNGVDPETLDLKVCVDRDGSASEYHDQAMCPAAGAVQRKLIRISATTRVQFSFLAIIGWFDARIQAQAVSEAASVDIVLVIDTSDSMTGDAACEGDREIVPGSGVFGIADDDDGDGLADDGCPVNGPPQRGPNPDNYLNDPAVCNVAPEGADGIADSVPGECHPFQEVKVAAMNFANRLYYPYDRLSIVTFDIVPTLQVPITSTQAVTDTVEFLRLLPVSPRIDLGVCRPLGPGNDPSTCTNTSIGGGLRVAGNEFGRHPVRVESVWVVILLTDGAANASEPSGTILNRYCPPSTWARPYCQDGNPLVRHSLFNTAKLNPNNTYDVANYDSDDYARDMADFVACPPAGADGWCGDSLNYAIDEGGQGALIYAVGLGRLVLQIDSGDPAAGDKTLRYISAVGDDGDATSDNCASIPVPTLTSGNDSYSCGNYYYSEFGTGLTAVFDSIASRLFTRLTQ
jgi:hypothetical protein